MADEPIEPEDTSRMMTVGVNDSFDAANVCKTQEDRIEIDLLSRSQQLLANLAALEQIAAPSLDSHLRDSYTVMNNFTQNSSVVRGTKCLQTSLNRTVFDADETA